MSDPEFPAPGAHPSNPAASPAATASLPRPKMQRAAWPFPVIWIIPLVVAIGASFYYYGVYQEHGPRITVTITDAAGIRTGETPVTVHGVRVGTVTQVDLAPDEQHAVLHVEFYRSTIELARENTQFWLVRPDLSGGNIQGLSTIISGPYLEALPGPGAPRHEFHGLDAAPVMAGDGVRIILRAASVDRLQLDSPVYYRGIQVGVVQDVRLGDDAASVNATLFIWHAYQRLLQSNSVFWPEHTTEVSGGLFSGVQVRLGSLRSALGGGLSFATPGGGTVAHDGDEYTLNEEPKKEWLAWAPHISWATEPTPNDNVGRDLRAQQGGLRSTIRVR